MARDLLPVLAPHLVHEKIERRHRERIEADRKARYRALLLFLIRGEEPSVREKLDVRRPPC
jgi:hypothetical protein